MIFSNVINILQDELESAKADYKAIKKQQKKGLQIDYRVNKLIRKIAGDDVDNDEWYLQRLIHELKEAIKILKKAEEDGNVQ